MSETAILTLAEYGVGVLSILALIFVLWVTWRLNCAASKADESDCKERAAFLTLLSQQVERAHMTTQALEAVRDSIREQIDNEAAHAKDVETLVNTTTGLSNNILENTNVLNELPDVMERRLSVVAEGALKKVDSRIAEQARATKELVAELLSPIREAIKQNAVEEGEARTMLLQELQNLRTVMIESLSAIERQLQENTHGKRD